MRTKLKRISDGAVIDKTFRAGEKFRAVRTETRKMQYLYADGTDAHFMDAESFEQIPVPEASLAEELKWTKPNTDVDLLFVDALPRASTCRPPLSLRSPTPSPACAATPPRAAATSPPPWRRAPRSRCRCSSTSARRSRFRPRPLLHLARLRAPARARCGPALADHERLARQPVRMRGSPVGHDDELLDPHAELARR